MEARKEIEILLEEMIDRYPFQHFYLPDGKVKIEHHFNIQPYERLILVLEGVKEEPMSLEGNLQTLTLHRGDFYLIRRHVWEYVSLSRKHDFLCLVPRNGYLRLVRYRVSDVPNGPGENKFETSWFHTCSLSDSLTHAFATLGAMEEYRQDEVLCAEAVRLILRLALLELRKDPVRRNKRLMTFETVRAFLDSHFAEPLTREDTARYFGLNPCYLSQIFRLQTGETFQAYLLKCRLAKAKFLLAQTSLAVKNIADECGWRDDAHFIRQFRATSGMTPGKYRLLHARNP